MDPAHVRLRIFAKQSQNLASYVQSICYGQPTTWPDCLSEPSSWSYYIGILKAGINLAALFVQKRGCEGCTKKISPISMLPDSAISLTGQLTKSSAACKMLRRKFDAWWMPGAALAL